MKDQLFDMLRALSDGEWQALANLPSDYKDIEPAVAALKSVGHEAEVRKGEIRLPEPLELLDENQLQAIAPDLPVSVYQNVDSTNRLALSAPPEQRQSGAVWLAEFQSAGRGRRGRSWISPYGRNLMLSMTWLLEGFDQSAGLSLAVGVSVTRVLQGLGISEPQLKWPNDIYLAGEKTGGILVETASCGDGRVMAVVGLGLNLSMPADLELPDGQAFTDINRHASAPVNRQSVAQKVIEQLRADLAIFQQQGLSAFLDEWRKRDFSLGKQVELRSGEQLVEGVATGIDSSGAILVDANAYHAGELSLRVRS